MLECCVGGVAVAKAVPLDALSCNLRATVRRVVELGEDLWGQGPKSQGDNTRLGALRGGGRRGLVQTDSFDGTPGPLLVLKPMASDSAAQKSNVSSTTSPSRSPRFFFWQKRSFVGCEVGRRRWAPVPSGWADLPSGDRPAQKNAPANQLATGTKQAFRVFHTGDAWDCL